MLERATAIRQPVSGTFELTARCNLACGMCYIRKPANDPHERANELTAAQWVDVTQQAVDAGMVFLTLTGGEILIRKDFFELYEPMTRMGLVITLFTNGTAITPAVAERLAKNPPLRVEISLYGATETAYDRVTGTANAYDKCLRGIRLLAEAGVNVVVKSTVTKYNAHELDPMKRMAAEWGVPFFAASLLTQRRDDDLSQIQDFRRQAKDAVDLEAADPATAAEIRDALAAAPPPPDADPFYCSAGKSSFTIGPFGQMSACIDLPLPGAPVAEIGFAEAWKRVCEFVGTVPVNTSCSSCALRNMCPSCPAWSYGENRTLNQPVKYLCDLAAERKRRFGAPEPRIQAAGG
ncbi:MAG: radical SAM protein [Armatimonadetes bacterium]|nr:radical SAM protein [Armatimonadota bacterium]